MNHFSLIVELSSYEWSTSSGSEVYRSLFMFWYITIGWIKLSSSITMVEFIMAESLLKDQKKMDERFAGVYSSPTLQSLVEVCIS